MTATYWTFDTAFDRVIGIEKGLVNDPLDPGRETKYGICKRSYPMVDICNLTLAQAKAIYLKDYWQRVSCDTIPNLVSMIVFDCAVLQGQPEAAKLLQQSVGVNDDGIIGPNTLRALAYATPLTLLNEFAARRALRIAHNNDAAIAHDGLGWYRRLATQHAASLTAFLTHPDTVKAMT